jgi:hypothetical protein
MLTEEQWMSIFDYAQTLKVTYGEMPVGNQIKGRFITVLVDRLADFWGRHKQTLIPFMTNLAIAALEAIVAARHDIDLVNPPGPP